MANVEPLTPGTILGDRFEIERVLGSGGFSVVYLAKDHRREDHAVVKELAPEDARRGQNGLVDLGPAGERLRSKFLQEGALQSRLTVPGIIAVRSCFSENGTAYIVSDYVPHSHSVEQMLRLHGRLPTDQALDIFYRLLDIVDHLHKRQLLHRDIKPSNVLIHQDGSVFLIDFGAAREWRQDATLSQTLTYTPGYAPPEQLSEKSKRGPASDIYSLSATLYRMLSGSLPPTPMDRVAGAPLDALPTIAREAGQSIANLLEAGLSLNMLARPQSILELRTALESTADELDGLDVHGLDKLLYDTKRLTSGRRQCPACDGILEDVKPLGRNVCPVCREGTVARRALQEELCPVCRSGALKRHRNAPKPCVCPCCGRGVLSYTRKGVLSPMLHAKCPCCQAEAEYQGGVFALCSANRLPETPPIGEFVRACNECCAIYEERPDGRLTQISPEPGRYVTLYPDEWARVAARLDPGVGNAECTACSADFFIDEASVTLLSSFHDPHDFASEYEGRRLQTEGLRWLAVGKTSPNKGLVCERCRTEFDFDGPQLRLVHSNHRRLARYAEESMTIENWSRAAKGLPRTGHESEIAERLPSALRESYRTGQIGFDEHAELIWKGNAHRIDTGQEAHLVVDASGLSYGGLFRKFRCSWDDIESCMALGDTVSITLPDEKLELQVSPVELTAHLTSGPCSIVLTAEDLAIRVNTTVQAIQHPVIARLRR